MQFNTKGLLLCSILLGLIAALLTAFYLGSFGLDWSTFYIDLIAAWIAWSIILPFIIRAIK
jgi:uncharacterized membrane protein YeaQ/YmgE (transglycosylase-associated protein family)